MSPRLLSAISVSMLVHVGLWSGFWQAAPRMSRSKASVLENSIFIDPAAIEAVKKARAESVKKKPAAAVVKPAAPAPKKLPLTETKAEKIPQLPPAAEVKKVEETPSHRTRSAVDKGGTLESEKTANASPLSAKSPTADRVRSTAPAAAAKTGADLMANPKTRGLFTDYFGSVKARIQQKLREKCAGRTVGSGSVQLAFVLSANGRLHKVYVMDRNSQVDGELKELAIESLKESAPFSDFPSDFNARQIAFNLTVYFDDL